MKTLITCMFLVMSIGGAKAQASYTVLETKAPFYPNEARFTTKILGLGEDFVFTHWQNYLEEHGGISNFVQNERGNFQMTTSNVEFPPMNDDVVTIETLMTPNAAETGVDLTISIKNSNGTYFSSKTESKEAVAHLKSWLLDFNQKLRLLEKEEVFNRIEIVNGNE